MNVIYKTTDTLNNLSYIGSKMNYVEHSNYLGSPSCKEGHPKYEKQQLFLQTIKNDRDRVTFEILEVVDSQNVKRVRERETFWQKYFNATQSSTFINGIYANATGRTCKKIFCIDLCTNEVNSFNSISQCEDTWNIKNVGSVVLGNRPSTFNKVCLSEDEYYSNKDNILEYIKNRYKKLFRKEGQEQTGRTILNIKTKEAVQCKAREVPYRIKSTGWNRKDIFIFPTLYKDEAYIELICKVVKTFDKKELQKLSLLNETTGIISSYAKLCGIYRHPDLRRHLQGITKTIGKDKEKLKIL